MKFDDLYRPAGLLGLAGATVVLGLAAGVAIVRDPALARRVLATGARGFARAQLAAAETVEDAIDLWEDLRAQARREVEDARFAAAAGDTSPPAQPSSEAAGAGRASVKAARPRAGAKKPPASPKSSPAGPPRAARKPRAPRPPRA